jgi:hypothetical protein
MFSAGQECVLEEGLALSNLSPGLPADMSGDDSIVMTFTAVPEPSSAILLPGLAIAARRRPVRRRKS